MIQVHLFSAIADTLQRFSNWFNKTVHRHRFFDEIDPASLKRQQCIIELFPKNTLLTMCIDVVINEINPKSLSLFEFLPFDLVNIIKFKHSIQSMSLHFLICKEKNRRQLCMWCAGFCFDHSKFVTLCVPKDNIQNYFKILKHYTCSECYELMFHKNPIDNGCKDVTCFNH